MQYSIPGMLGVKPQPLCYAITIQAMLICYDCLYTINHESISTNCKLNSFRSSLSHFFLNIYSDSGYICHIYTRDKFYNYTNHTYITTNFQCKTMQVHFNRDFLGVKCCRHWDSNPQPSDLDHLALGVSHHYGFFTSLRLSWAQDW